MENSIIFYLCNNNKSMHMPWIVVLVCVRVNIKIISRLEGGVDECILCLSGVQQKVAENGYFFKVDSDIELWPFLVGGGAS
jgi:hypothetical protein